MMKTYHQNWNNNEEKQYVINKFINERKQLIKWPKIENPIFTKIS